MIKREQQLTNSLTAALAKRGRQPNNSVTNVGGGVSIDYSKDSKGEFYIHSISGNDMIDDFNKQNLEIMNFNIKNFPFI